LRPSFDRKPVKMFIVSPFRYPRYYYSIEYSIVFRNVLAFVCTCSPSVHNRTISSYFKNMNEDSVLAPRMTFPVNVSGRVYHSRAQPRHCSMAHGRHVERTTTFAQVRDSTTHPYIRHARHYSQTYFLAWDIDAIERCLVEVSCRS
jgi:hypothetical protein